MSLAAAVLRPKSVASAPAQGPSRPFDLAVEFLESLMADPEGLGATLEALSEAGGGHLQAFILSRMERFRKAEGKLRLVFKPFIDIVTEFLAGAGGSVPEALPAGLKALRGLVAMARKQSVTRMLRDLIRIGKDDLDFNPQAVEALFRQCLEGAAARLQGAVDGGDLSEAALKRYEWGLNLRNFAHLVLEEMEWPSLDAEVLVEAVGKLYDRKGADAFLAKIQKVLDAAESVAGPLGLVLQAIMNGRITVSGGGSVGAAAAGDTPGDGTTTTTVTVPTSFYASWVLRAEAKFEITAETTTIGPIPAVTYNCITPKGMEELAFHSLWITDLTETILHVISAEQNDLSSNIMNGMWDLFNTLNTPINKIYLPSWLQWVVISPLTTLAGLETVRCSGGADACFPLIQILGDAGEVVLYRRWTWLAREFVLSVVTLANINEAKFNEWKTAYDASLPFATELNGIETALADPNANLTAAQRSAKEARRDAIKRTQEYWDYEFTLRQANQNQFHGLVYGFGEIGALVLPAILAENDRMDYGFIGGFITGPMAGKMFGGMAIAMAFRGVGLLTAAGIARKGTNDIQGALYTTLLLANERFLWNPKRATDGETAGRWFWLIGNFFIEWVMQAIYLYLFTNGNTDEGTLAAYPGVPGRFPGYPDAATAPHLLPWAAGDLIECAQNPMGIWSHFPAGGQAHAYDFSHDAGTEVLASRSGIVTTLTQNNINNNTVNWNNIEVLSMRIAAAGDAGAMPAVPPPPNLTRYTDTGTTDNPRVATLFEAGTLFPPYWDVYGNQWPALPGTMPLLPSGAVLPAGSALGPGLPAASAFVFIEPAHDRGLAGVTYPAGAFFSDGTTPIPAGVTFAPDAPVPPTLITPMYAAGTTFFPMRANFTAPPWVEPPGPGVAGFAPAPGSTFMDGTAIPAGLVLPPDAAVVQPWLPRPHQATPMYLPGTTFFAYTPTPMPVAGNQTNLVGPTGYFNMGTNFLPNGAPIPAIPAAVPTGVTLPPTQLPTLNFQWMIPVAFMTTEYGHALSGFTSIPNHTFAPPTGSAAGTAAVIRDRAPGEAAVAMPGQPSGTLTDVFGTADPTQVQGRFVAQGRVVTLSGDTGVSAYNHLHTHVLMDSSANFRPREPYPTSDGAGNFNGPFGMIFTAPFVYRDASHGMQHGFREAPQTNGVCRAMTWYESQNARTGP